MWVRRTMPVKSSSDKRYLEKHGDKWRVVLSVPRSLHKQLGTKLKQSLETDSLAVANRLKWGVIKELRDRIDLTLGADVADHAAVLREALLVRKEYRAAMDPNLENDIRRAAEARAYEILGPETSVVRDEEGDFPVYDKRREQLASSYMRVATGSGTPVKLHYPEYVGQLSLNRRTIADDQRGIDYLVSWCAKNGVKDDLSAISTKVAKQFAADLPALANGIAARTVLKYITRLAQYWKFLAYKEIHDENPWLAVVVKVEETPHEEEERAFTNAEVQTLLLGDAAPEMRDLMMIAALTGARLDVIVDLKVGDTANNAFKFKPQKKEKSSRYVPIHPSLAEIVERRTRDKAPTDEFFPEFPGPKKETSLRERSFKASNEFTAYRRRCGVDEQIPGRRRSLVNFHSFRRWFITEAERANVRPELISALVGHKRSGMTLGRYSEGPEMKAARRAIAAVKLPRLDGPVIEAQAVTPRERKGAVKKAAATEPI
jgi:integrase